MSKARTALSKARKLSKARQRAPRSQHDEMHCPRCGDWLVHWGCRHCDRWTALGVVVIASYMLMTGLIVGLFIGVFL